MKKVLSVVLLISMLLGMWIMPAAAVEGDEAAGAGEVLYYVDGQSRASWIGSFCNNQFTVAEDGSYFTTNAFLPAPFGQQVSISEVVQLSISLRVTDTTRSSGDYIALWHNAVDDSVQFRYYPMQNILALYIGDAIVGEPYEVNDWATGSEAVFHVLTMDMAEDGTVNCYADGEQVFETTLSDPVWTEKMPIVWNQGSKPFDIAYFAITTPSYDLANLPAYAAARNRDQAYYVDANSPKWVIDSFTAGNTELVEGEDFFLTGAVTSSPWKQIARYSAPMIITAEISGQMAREEGHNVQLWLNMNDEQTHSFRYYPIAQKLTLEGPSGEIESVEVDWASGADSVFHKLALIVEADGTLRCYADGECVITYQIPSFDISKQTGLVPILWKDGLSQILVKSFAVYELNETVEIPEYLFYLDENSEVTDEFMKVFMAGTEKDAGWARLDDGTYWMNSSVVAPGPTTGAGQQDIFITTKDFVVSTTLKMNEAEYEEGAYRGLWLNSNNGAKILQYKPGAGKVTYGAFNGADEYSMDVDWAIGENAEWHTLALAVSISDAGPATVKVYVDQQLVHTANYESYTDQTEGKGFQLLMFGNSKHLMQNCIIADGSYDPTNPQNVVHPDDHEMTEEILILKEASCAGEGTNGEKVVRCASCDAFEIVAYSVEHIASEWIVDTEATCTAAGSQHKECTVCGETLETEAIEMIDHTPSDWIVDKEATEEEEGSQHKECTVCKTVLETEAIPKLEPTKLPFVDVDEDAWYYEYVEYVYKNNLFLGTSDTTFEPGTVMTRAMFVRLLANYEGVDFTQYEDAELPFTDVEMDSWYGTAVAWAYENNVVLGTSETTFNPGDEITREQMCLMLVNYMEHKEITLDVSDEEVSFTDADQIADWAKEAVEFCAGAGLVQGPGDGTFNPKGTASRAEVATLITNFVRALEA